MGLKVNITPFYTHADHGDGGIRRVVEAQVRHLPALGVEVVMTPEEADVLASHGTAVVTRPGKPVVNHNHGLYWAKHDWAEWAHEANSLVIEAMGLAVAHTAPSIWVANALRRGMLVYPEVVYHGVDFDDWQSDARPQNYVLWNKARSDFVSNPADMNILAASMPAQWFVTTIGNPAANVRIVGKQPYPVMKSLIQEAGVYLATARETFGIGTLEALASGVPVAGWAWGGQIEIVRQGETGYLAKYGDYKALADCVDLCLRDRARLSANARQDAKERWGWEPRIRQYAEIYERTAKGWYYPRPKVSVIVTCYNLSQYLGDCLRSIQRQTMDDWECVLVDDCSTDATAKVAALYAGDDARIKYVRTPENMGLSGARNYGFRQSAGRYTLFLDADDMLTENSLAVQAGALDSMPSLHIVTGCLDIVNADGSERRRNSWPEGKFNWHAQMAHANQMIYSSMMRREVMERSGGYRQRDWRAEDAAFWCRVTSLGFLAERITDAPTLVYRERGDSKSKGEPGDGPWTAWFPWSTAETFEREAMKQAHKRVHPRPDLVPFGAQGTPPNGKAWPVKDYSEPIVSVIIPVGPGHSPWLIDALESCVAQTFTEWEAIVVNDTGEEWADGFDSPVAGAPYAKVVATAGRQGAAAARNEGARYARGEVLVFLDADDWMLPTALERMVDTYEQIDGIVYTDILQMWDDPRKPMEPFQSDDFECGAVLRRMRHTMQCLVPRLLHEKVGGFDTNAPGWEDWDYLIALQAAGACSARVPEPLFVYRKTTGSVREDCWERKDSIVKWIHAKWLDYYKGRAEMPCQGCPKPSGRTIAKAKAASLAQINSTGTLTTGDAASIAYVGSGPKRIAVRGPITGTVYQFKRGEYRYVEVRDAGELMLRRGPDKQQMFARRVVTRQVAQPTNAPQPSMPSMRPILPSMPDSMPDPDPVPVAPVDVADVSKMDVPVAKAAIRDASLEMLDLFEQQERAGKFRQPVIQTILYWRRKKSA